MYSSKSDDESEEVSDTKSEAAADIGTTIIIDNRAFTRFRSFFLSTQEAIKAGYYPKSHWEHCHRGDRFPPAWWLASFRWICAAGDLLVGNGFDRDDVFRRSVFTHTEPTLNNVKPGRMDTPSDLGSNAYRRFVN